MIGVPQLFEDRWQQGGGGGGNTTPPAAPVKRGRGRPRKHPLPQDKGGGGATPRRLTKGSRRVHTDDEWSDWNEGSFDAWQLGEWTPQQPGDGLYAGYSPQGRPLSVTPPYGGGSSPTTPGTPLSAPSATGSNSLLAAEMQQSPPPLQPPPDVAADWRDDYCYSMTYDINYILSTTSPENTKAIPRLPPSTDQSGNRLVHWHTNPSPSAAATRALYACTGYDGAEEGPPPPAPS